MELSLVISFAGRQLLFLGAFFKKVLIHFQTFFTSEPAFSAFWFFKDSLAISIILNTIIKPEPFEAAQPLGSVLHGRETM